MIRNFSNKETKALYEGEWVSLFQNFRQQAEKRLQILDSATDLVDLRQLPSNRFKVLIGRRTGQFSIRVNKQWRICFRWEDGEPCDVEIVDYH